MTKISLTKKTQNTINTNKNKGICGNCKTKWTLPAISSLDWEDWKK
jgi:hypothetical protein